MPLTMYAASTPRFVHMLNNLSSLLDKAQVHIDARKLDPAALTTARLFPDMFHLARQVQVACDIAKGAVARLGGVDVPKHEDTEQTIEELKARIAKTVAFIESVPQTSIDSSADRDITLKLGKQDYTFTGMDYLLKFAQPNFYFHVTTAYNILRHNGVELVKKDYVGKF